MKRKKVKIKNNVCLVSLAAIATINNKKRQYFYGTCNCEWEVFVFLSIQIKTAIFISFVFVRKSVRDSGKSVFYVTAGYLKIFFYTILSVLIAIVPELQFFLRKAGTLLTANSIFIICKILLTALFFFSFSSRRHLFSLLFLLLLLPLVGIIIIIIIYRSAVDNEQ